MDSISQATLAAAHVDFFYRTARSYKRDALIIHENYSGTCSPTFHLLSSLAFELLPKVLLGSRICLKYKDDVTITDLEIRDEISKEMSKYNHKLDNLYFACPNLVKFLDINNIQEFENGYIWEYRINLSSDTDYQHRAIKEIEAIRYGSFARNSDVVTMCVGDHLLIDLLNKVESFVDAEVSKMWDKLRKP